MTKIIQTLPPPEVYTIINGNGPSSKMLTLTCDEFNFKEPPIDPAHLRQCLVKTMCVNRGFGLAAPQCGLMWRVFVLGHPDNEEDNFCFFNPKITYEAPEKTIMTEGCLSYPNLFIKIRRPSSVRIRFQNEKGEWDVGNFGGLTSHIILHEMDHLDGVTFHQKAHPLHLKKGKDSIKKYKKRRQKFNEQTATMIQ